MFLIVVVGHRFVVGKELLAQLLIYEVMKLCSLLADHSSRIAGVGICSTTPCGLFACVSCVS